MTTSNDEIRHGEQPNGEYYIMCGKCGDEYRTDKETYERNKNVRWRCTACVYMWL